MASSAVPSASSGSSGAPADVVAVDIVPELSRAFPNVGRATIDAAVAASAGRVTRRLLDGLDARERALGGQPANLQYIEMTRRGHVSVGPFASSSDADAAAAAVAATAAATQQAVKVDTHADVSERVWLINHPLAFVDEALPPDGGDGRSSAAPQLVTQTTGVEVTSPYGSVTRYRCLYWPPAYGSYTIRVFQALVTIAPPPTPPPPPPPQQQQQQQQQQAADGATTGLDGLSLGASADAADDQDTAAKALADADTANTDDKATKAKTVKGKAAKGSKAGLSKKERRRQRGPKPFPFDAVVSLTLVAQSPASRFARALDDLYETIYWSPLTGEAADSSMAAGASGDDGDGAGGAVCWSAELEESIIGLTLCVEDHLGPVISQVQGTLQAFQMGARSVESMVDLVRTDIADALETQGSSLLPIGRLHQNLHQFVEMTAMVRFPDELLEAIARFERAKCSLVAAGRIEAACDEVLSSIDAYVVCLVQLEQLSLQDAYIGHLGHIKMALLAVRERAAAADVATATATSIGADATGAVQPPRRRRYIDLRPLWGLRSRQSMYHMSQKVFGALGMGANGGVNPCRVSHWPALPVENVLACGRRAQRASVTPSSSTASVSTSSETKKADEEEDDRLIQQVDDLITTYTETLAGDTLTVGSLMNHRLGRAQPGDVSVTDADDRDARLILGLLYLGLGYVCFEGAIIALGHERRASLPLCPVPADEHKLLRKRCRDAQRVLRTVPRPDGRLQLRVNTDFALCMTKLAEHHAQSWVVPELERVWRRMFDRQELVVFELWYGHEMIAADIGHPVRGGAFYVATRWFDHSFKRFLPGFVLSLVSARLLRDLFGYQLWDLGGTDANPQMAYKRDVTVILSRATFVPMFRRLRAADKRVMPVRPGVLVGDLGPQHVLLHLEQGKQTHDKKKKKDNDNKSNSSSSSSSSSATTNNDNKAHQ